MRCYNGCPGPKLQAVLNEQAEARRRVREIEPEACVTYHYPQGGETGGYVVHVWGGEISGYHEDYVAACNEAYSRLTEGP